MLKKIFVLLLTTLVLIYWFKSPNQEQQVRLTLSELLEISQIDTKLHPIAAATRAKEISEFFMLPLTIDASNLGYPIKLFSDSKNLSQKIAHTILQIKSLESSIHIKEMMFEDKSVIVRLKLDILAALAGREDQFYESHIVEVSLESIEDNWLINKVTQLENLRGD